MELKYRNIDDAKIETISGFNRTFMELKCCKFTADTYGIVVLIVPLWN